MKKTRVQDNLGWVWLFLAVVAAGVWAELESPPTGRTGHQLC